MHVIDVAIRGERNMIKKETEKILKCKDLITGIQRIWNVKGKLIPVVIGRLEPFQNHSDNT
jgi:methyl coenzyme M reductase subunit D